MHEFSLATEIVETVKRFADDGQAGTIEIVRLRIGELTRVEGPQLRFCFHSLTRETMLERTALEIEPVRAKVRCTWCTYQGPPHYASPTTAGPAVPLLKCPHCRQAAVAMQGHECEIKAIETARPPDRQLAAPLA